MNYKVVDGIFLTLTIIGALNWGLIALFQFDLVAFLFGNMTFLARIIYGLVGISGIYMIRFFSYLCIKVDELT